ncbi:MAG: hypothetical protein M1818_000364 [Claussenomyces sp. TS43310]|nr:MAG: hypothetical protein M1818_000364 [Claussenomyces sp. TS43310]
MPEPGTWYMMNSYEFGSAAAGGFTIIEQQFDGVEIDRRSAQAYSEGAEGAEWAESAEFLDHYSLVLYDSTNLDMSNDKVETRSSARNVILTLSVSRHLSGVPIDKVIKADWDKEKAHNMRDSFDNVGFNVDPKDVPGTLSALRHELKGRSWDGILIGWCIRGHVEFTVLFEEVVAMCCEVMKSAPQTKIMFCTGPDNLVETVSRNFPTDSGL